LSEAAALRTLEAVAAFTQRIRLAGADSAGIATSAMRRARNAVEFGEQFRAVAGTPLRVLSGAEEAAATFRGAMFGAPRDGAIRAVLDVGGGSTECATGRDGRLERERSVEIGSVRLTEQYPELTGSAPGAAARAAASRARTAIAAELGWLASFRPVAEVRAVAGTPLTLGAIARRSSPEDVAGELLEMNLEERRAVEGMIAQRADILVAGGLIVSEALRLLERSAARLEVNDLLLGYLLGEFALERSPQ